MLSSKRALQIAVVLGAIVPISAGLAGIIMGPDMIPGTGESSISLDSHYRYLSGLLLGIGYAYWWCVPAIETKGKFFRLLTAIIFVGGLARLTSLLAIGTPDTSMLFGLGMEILVTPAIAFWQYRVAKGYFKN